MTREPSWAFVMVGLMILFPSAFMLPRSETSIPIFVCAGSIALLAMGLLGFDLSRTRAGVWVSRRRNAVAAFGLGALAVCTTCLAIAVRGMPVLSACVAASSVALAMAGCWIGLRRTRYDEARGHATEPRDVYIPYEANRTDTPTTPVQVERVSAGDAFVLSLGFAAAAFAAVGIAFLAAMAYVVYVIVTYDPCGACRHV